ncbi:hypothetical protein BS17DRAFT_821472 [Gyrodon lividus]|nr:hypothetical protein BS17DRAFT_821472 [Gyrodon lividus]
MQTITKTMSFPDSPFSLAYDVRIGTQTISTVNVPAYPRDIYVHVAPSSTISIFQEGTGWVTWTLDDMMTISMMDETVYPAPCNNQGLQYVKSKEAYRDAKAKSLHKITSLANLIARDIGHPMTPKAKAAPKPKASGSMKATKKQPAPSSPPAKPTTKKACTQRRREKSPTPILPSISSVITIPVLAVPPPVHVQEAPVIAPVPPLMLVPPIPDVDEDIEMEDVPGIGDRGWVDIEMTNANVDEEVAGGSAVDEEQGNAADGHVPAHESQEEAFLESLAGFLI